MTDTLHPDAPQVTREDSVLLMTHHLQLAAMYFETTPQDVALVRSRMEQHMRTSPDQRPALVAAQRWLTAIDEVYRSMR